LSNFPFLANSLCQALWINRAQGLQKKNVRNAYIELLAAILSRQNMRLILSLILISTQTFGQWIASEEIDETKVQKWIPKLTIEYQGVYRFGDSENESDLLLFFFIGKVIGQIRSGSWSTDGKSWLWNYENLSDIKIEGNKFTSSKANGEFVIYDKGNGKIKGLKIMNPWSGVPENGQWEIGQRKGSPNDFLAGKFIEASLRLLDENELVMLNKSDLKLMRNEIFARYGLKFNTGGEMDNYFRNLTWYQSQHDNVDKFLTDLEKENIRTIQQLESR
jgi:hypothetical protein